ncbi:hypothetical protein NOR_01857 [Metarhizium rileyi]|uniref:Uncharacterized protein n=1 Tax=Metarhizium rileyi (strain RCEF 4871) TaxID=1649241 RepID=A0A167I2J5_METRR|nr:hypothetical protein NOR_01857 [Metarhizium rileyi RCEF 4871]TWU74423.1 hypothetical protein ED733_003937 [Metarhizium rileyi]
MVSSLITSPRNGDTLGANQAFQIRVQMRNIVTGQFTNATSTYYSAPQQLDKSGRIFGHTHFSLQQLENQNQAPNPRVFTFFKGVNDPAQAGLLTADVEKGLSPGTYRVCSMASSSNHQPVMMPVAQRGAQDDCIRFNVAGQGGQQRNNAQGGQQRNNAQGGQRNQVANQRKPVQGGQRSQVVNQGLRGQNGLNRRV